MGRGVAMEGRSLRGGTIIQGHVVFSSAFSAGLGVCGYATGLYHNIPGVVGGDVHRHDARAQLAWRCVPLSLHGGDGRSWWQSYPVSRSCSLVVSSRAIIGGALAQSSVCCRMGEVEVRKWNVACL